MPNTNYCMVDPSGGPITVKVMVNNAIQTAGIFILWKKNNGNWEKKEKFTVQTGDTGEATFQLVTKPSEIENDSLAWKMRACSMIQGVQRGDFIVEIIQDGKTQWKKKSTRNVPQCSDGKAVEFGGHVIFKHLVNSNTNTIHLWKNIK